MANPPIEILPGTHCELGEGPFWDAPNGRLLVVDIIGKSLAELTAATGAVRRIATPDFPTAMALRRNGEGAIVAMASGVFLVDLDTGETKPFANPDPTPGNRLNDGKCDPQGRFWVGSMQTNFDAEGKATPMDRNSGALFRVDPDGSVTRHTEHEIGISNTLAWTADGATFYFGDSLANTIYAFDFDAATGTISGRRPHTSGSPHGVPDGSAIDTDGCLWNARYGGGRLLRITPDGKVDREIELPVANPTCCAFGGADYGTLYVTSARDGLGAAAKEADGAILRIDGLARGMAPDLFAG